MKKQTRNAIKWTTRRGRFQSDAGPPFGERFRVGEILGESLARISCDTVSEG